MQSWAINTQTFETNLGLLRCNKVFSGSIIPPPITMNTNKFTKHKDRHGKNENVQEASEG